MKYLILLGDGMADWPLPDYDNRTPLEVANTPAMDDLVAKGVLGRFCPIPEGMPPGSDIGNLSMFGYNPRSAFRGRAPMEAANQGITLAENEVAFRCNLVTIENGIMRDFTAGHIETDEAAQIIESLNAALSERFPVTLSSGVSYRHLCITTGDTPEAVEQMVELECEPPHNITDKPVEPWLPKGNGNEMTRAIMAAATELLADHPVNKARIARGDLPATHIWLWGQGKAPNVTPYKDKFNITGAVISAVDLVMGIGVCAGLDVIRVPGATGWIDTNYEGKSQAGLDALSDHDFVYIHLEAPDETAHQGRADLKIQAIEDYDSKIVAPALRYQETHPDVRILIAPDHFTTIETKTHAGGPVPFGICGPGITPNGHSAYSERAAEATDVLIEDGHRLVESMIRDAVMTFPKVARAR